MAGKNNATCAICGKGYYLCLSCRDMMSVSPWKKHTDTSEHYKIYQIIQGYSTGVYTKEEACEKLDTVDLSDFNSLKDNIKDVINDIKKAKKKTFAASPAVEDESSNMVEKPKQRKRKDSEPSVDVVEEEFVVE